MVGSAFGQVVPNGQAEDFSISQRSFPSVRSHWYQLDPDTGNAVFSSPNEWAFWPEADSGKWAFGILPIVQSEFGYSSRADAVYALEGGFALQAKRGKFSLHLDAVGGLLKQPFYLDRLTDSLGIISSRGRDVLPDGRAYLMPSAAINFRASDIFDFELGFGKNFFGNGHRSLFLGDAAYNYPYLKIETEIWNIKYVNLFSALNDISADPSDPSVYRNKFSSTHYLNWAVSPRFNVGLFETIVWQGSDTLSDRGFDPNYLNPIIFFRPVEFSVGSPDNAIIGLDLSFKATPQTMVYGQLVFDEFLLSEFRARDGWWGNKWGAQLGFKSIDLFGAKGSFLRGEFNMARPFTYTHGSVLQNFGHYNQPLAHPLATNFYEGLVQAYYEIDRYFAEAQWNYAVYGRDPDSLNLGGDIYRSYANPAEIYGNEIGQGVKSKLFYQRLAAGLILHRHLNLRASLFYIYRREDQESSSLNNEHIFGVRLATELFRPTVDF